jgi:proteasome lid subunit RPN8/RPN11
MTPVHRTKPLPVAAARGRLVVTEAVVKATIRALRTFVGGDGEPHEGLVYWAGRIVGVDTYALAVVVPECKHGPLGVLADAGAMGTVAEEARAYRLAIIAQVHSHPGDDTRHSDGDDELVFMPFEGMFSLVVARYGKGAIEPQEGAGLHQFQDGRWVEIDRRDNVLIVVPSALELRNG